MRSIGFYSDKGVGKTTLSFNMAINLAKSGSNVCIIDLDLIAPRIHNKNLDGFEVIEKNPQNKWINDYLLGDKLISESIVDVSDIYSVTESAFYVGFANPDKELVQSLVQKYYSDNDIHTDTAILLLNKLQEIKLQLQNPPYNIDLFIADNHLGWVYYL